jgi:hypothetical protein
MGGVERRDRPAEKSKTSSALCLLDVPSQNRLKAGGDWSDPGSRCLQEVFHSKFCPPMSYSVRGAWRKD